MTTVGSLETAAQGVGEHLLGEAAGKRGRARKQCGSQLGRALECPPAGKTAGRIDGLLPIVRPPAADGIEVLEAEAERVHAPVARGAGRIAPVPLHLLPERARRPMLRLFLEGFHARRRRRRR